MTIKAPFPWFGGKSRVADVVWRAFGNVPNYVEPFAGSLAVLLARPHEAKIETVNDADAYLSNFWRAVQHDPGAVARHCDWPVNEADLHARHRWLVGRAEFREQLLANPEYFDARIAGWWVWGLSQWIGGAWCQVRETQPRRPPNMSHGGNGTGVHKQSLTRKPAREHLRNGRLVHSEARPDLQLRRPANKPQGVHARLISEQMPDLHGFGGKGVMSSRLPSLGNARGVHGAEKPPCEEWFAEIMGMGHYTRAAHEVCIVATRGKPKVRDRAVRSVFFAPRGEHSAKPRAFRLIVERLHQGPYAELFARDRWGAWSQFGDELPGGAAAPVAEVGHG